MSGSLSSDEQKMKGDVMEKDKRTKAELLVTLDVALKRQHQMKDATDGANYRLRLATAEVKATETKVANLKQSLETIHQMITTTVALKHPETLAFGGVEVVWYHGKEIHPDYKGDSEEVRLLKLLDDKCQEALG